MKAPNRLVAPARVAAAFRYPWSLFDPDSEAPDARRARPALTKPFSPSRPQRYTSAFLISLTASPPRLPALGQRLRSTRARLCATPRITIGMPPV